MRIFVISKRTLIFIALGIIALIIAVIAFTSENAPTAFNPNKKLPIYSVERTDQAASISFDAAWGNSDTQILIDILEKYDVKATFFVTGQWAKDYPESVKALHDAGHEVMSHSNQHKDLTELSRGEVAEQISKGADKVEAITGVRPNLIRPPYGAYDNKLIEVCAELNVYCVQWDVDSHDWMNKAPNEIAKRVLDRIKPGSIALFHNDAKNTPAALPGILEGIKEKGINLVPISQLIYKDNYTIDGTGRQITNAPTPAPTPDRSKLNGQLYKVS